MSRARHVTLLTVTATVASLSASAPADAQLLRRIREDAARKVDARRTRVEDHVVERATTAVDSTVEKTGRGADTVIARTGGVVDTVINRSERGVGRVVSAAKGSPDALGADLADGRAVLDGVRFAEGAATPRPDADAYLRRVAARLVSAGATFLIEGHTASSGDAAADQALSEARAGAVKARLVALGVPAARLFALGYGASRPDDATGAAPDRVELVRMQ